MYTHHIHTFLHPLHWVLTPRWGGSPSPAGGCQRTSGARGEVEPRATNGAEEDGERLRATDGGDGIYIAIYRYSYKMLYVDIAIQICVYIYIYTYLHLYISISIPKGRRHAERLWLCGGCMHIISVYIYVYIVHDMYIYIYKHIHIKRNRVFPVNDATKHDLMTLIRFQGSFRVGCVANRV